MAELPTATTRVKAATAAAASGIDLICLLMPCALNADNTPYIAGNPQAIVDQNGYSEGVEYAALHIQKTRKSVMVVPMPIVTPGVVSRGDVSGNTGSATSTITAGADGVLAEHDGVLSVLDGGVVGTDQILLGLSLDGGRVTKSVRFGTANAYTVPLFGIGITLGAGNLVAGQIIHTWHGSAPLSDAGGYAAARAALAQQGDLFRSALLLGDLSTSDQAQSLVNEVNAYETENDRFIYVRASISDRLPQAAKSKIQSRMTGAPSLTFLEVSATGDTVTRSAGSWITDGFVIGDTVTITGSAGNNVTGPIASLSATVLTFGTTDLVNEGPVAGCNVVGSATLTFAEVGATSDTITRSKGSWFTDGFRVGDLITVTGTASNNIVAAPIASLSATVITLGSVDLTPEALGSFGVTLTAGQTKAAWMAAQNAEFADVDGEFRIDLAVGRGRIESPYTKWEMRRSAAWFASVREYQHDLHITTWRKSDGECGADLFDTRKKLVEWDDRADGGAASKARLTALRTYSNDGRDAFIAQSLTRADANSLLSQTHNVAVVDLAQTVTQLQTENSCIGRTDQLNPDGTMTAAALSAIAGEVNHALSQALSINAKNEGPRTSFVQYTPNADDVFNVPDAVLHGVVQLELDGTIHDVATDIDVS